MPLLVACLSLVLVAGVAVLPAAGQYELGEDTGIDDGPVSAEGDTVGQGRNAAEYCFQQVGFGQEPIPVAKTPDLSVVLSEVWWDYDPSIGCYLVIDDYSQEVLRASTADLSLEPPTDDDQRTAEYCYATRALFGRTPVDIAKTADHSKVLAQVKWGRNDAIGCYLVLNNNAVAALQAAARSGQREESGPEEQAALAVTEADIIAAEAEMVDLVNLYRDIEGVFPVANHPELAAVARRWSQIMAEEGDFRHNPRYSEQYPSGWMLSGENITWQTRFDTLSQAVEESFGRFRRSPGHYANMVKVGFTHLGVGIAIDDDGGFWLTQNFARYPPETQPRADVAPIQAVYAVPAGVTPVVGRAEAIADTIAAAQRWFRTQTDGRQPLFKMEGNSVSVATVFLQRSVENDIFGDTEQVKEFYDQIGASPGDALLMVVEGKLPQKDACAWVARPDVLIPIGNCGLNFRSNPVWPDWATYIVAHELTHLLGAPRPCAPNFDGIHHVSDDPRDILYDGSLAHDFSNVTLDVGNDDYYRHGREDCLDIAYSPLLGFGPIAETAPTSDPTPEQTPPPTPVNTPEPEVRLSKGRSARGVSSGCTGANCHYMRVELVNFEQGTYTVYCAHHGVPSVSYPPGSWWRYSTSAVVSEICIWGFTDPAYVIVENPRTGERVVSNDASWP